MATIKQYDSARTLVDQLLLGGNPIDLTNATVVLVFKNRATGARVERAATLANALAGVVNYKLTAEDVALEGDHPFEIELRRERGDKLCVPTESHAELKINPAL